MTAHTPLAQLLQIEPDLHSLMLAVVKAWESRYAPRAEWSCLVSHFGEGLPSNRVMIPSAFEASQPLDEPHLLPYA